MWRFTVQKIFLLELIVTVCNSYVRPAIMYGTKVWFWRVIEMGFWLRENSS